MARLIEQSQLLKCQAQLLLIVTIPNLGNFKQYGFEFGLAKSDLEQSS